MGDISRIRRIEKITGLNLKDQEDRTLVLLADRWRTVSLALRPA
jgi:hypothetical protein